MKKLYGLIIAVVLTSITCLSQVKIAKLCFDDFRIPGTEYHLEKIPIGCEVIDCCPGCPGPGFVEQFKVIYELKGTDIGFVELQIENYKGLKYENADVESGSVQLKQKSNVFSGIDPLAKKPMVIAPVFKLSKPDIKKLESKWKQDLANSPDREIQERYTLVVRQVLRDITIRVTEYNFYLRWCFPRPTNDKIRLLSNDSNDVSLIVNDGKRSGLATCLDDQLLNSTGTVSTGHNMINKGTCNEEIIVFSLDDAMGMNEAPNWTATNGETRNVTLGAPYVMTLNIYIMNGTFNNTRTRAQNDVARANQLYNSSRCGIQFVANYIDATTDPQTAGLMNVGCGSSANFRTDIGFTANTLNIYYNGDPAARGWECGNPPTNIILIASYATNETLAHEIGHALTLVHTNNLNNDGLAGDDFPATNVMWGGGVNRNSFTEGQCFRCNIRANSSLIAYGVSAVTTRNCSDTDRTGRCLPHEFDQ